jgi:hypothetical protein
MTLNSIEKEWKGFSEMVFKGHEPTAVQVAEMKKAFFAGAWSMFAAIEEIGEPHISEDTANVYLLARREELQMFQKDLTTKYVERN